MQNINEIYQCEQREEAEPMGVTILIYIMVFYIYEAQTVVIDVVRIGIRHNDWPIEDQKVRWRVCRMHCQFKPMEQ